MAEQNSTQQPMAEQNSTQQPMAEQNSTQQPMAEQNTTQQPMAEQNSTQQPMAEQNYRGWPCLSVSPQQEQPAADRDTQQRPSRTRQAHRPASLPQDRSSSLGHSETDSSSSPSIPEVDPKLFSKRMRVRRKAGAAHAQGEYSVCDNISVWLGNLTKATDIAGSEVEVLPEVKIDNVRKRQFFLRDHLQRGHTPGGGAGARGGASGGISKAGCRGIDSRHWNSYCTNTHTYVRALTKSKEQTAWRLIRIHAACVCVLSRKSWRH
ncbi:LOW QUALITY PROTEIN: neurotrophin-7-like [Oncorhynchus keta]|uniref:LOW QUALITY PROTEIN: neurotrophin-7-like n=1 Tax=Oncorhynchus keta TaxID=8018 RepID=UPI00227ABCD3|nr:LOW QUALITY PROTEIN: neurotrophin-7-like [Oncorhynchus keta]